VQRAVARAQPLPERLDVRVRLKHERVAELGRPQRLAQPELHLLPAVKHEALAVCMRV
jgi:hypothetical protein